MKSLALLLVVLAGCDSLFNLEHLPNVIDAGGAHDGDVVDVVEPEHLDAQTGGVIAYFPLDDTGFKDSISGRPATCMGTCPTVGTGKVGMAARFGGASCLVFPELPLSEGAAFIVSFWVNLTAAGSQTYVAKPYGAFDLDSFEVESDENSMLRLEVSNGGGNVPVTTTFAMPVTQWVRIELHYDGQTMTIIANGLVLDSQTLSIAVDAGPLLIGCDEDTLSVTNGMMGLIDDLRVTVPSDVAPAR